MLSTAGFGGYELPCGSLAELRAEIVGLLAERRRESRLIGYLNPHVFNVSHRDPTVRCFLERCDVISIDGVGIVVASVLFHGRRLPRVWMTGLFDAVLDSPDAAGAAIVIGGSESENGVAIEAMRSRATTVRLVAGYHGYAAVADYDEILRRHADVDLVLVGMGCPKSEAILLQAQRLCPRALCWNIGGGTIRYYAGAKARPPRWIQRLGCQWVYRMVGEPHTRRRYLVDIPLLVSNSLRFRR